MIVVKARTVGKDEVAFDFLKAQRSILVDLVISRFISILHQLFGAKTACIEMRIFQLVIPLHVRAMLGITPHQLDRFGHNIEIFRAGNSDAVLCFQPKHAVHTWTGNHPRR